MTSPPITEPRPSTNLVLSVSHPSSCLVVWSLGQGVLVGSTDTPYPFYHSNTLGYIQILCCFNHIILNAISHFHYKVMFTVQERRSRLDISRYANSVTTIVYFNWLCCIYAPITAKVMPV